MRFALLVLLLLAVACGGSSVAISSPEATRSLAVSPTATPAPYITVPPTPTPVPTPEPTAVPIYHGPPYTIAIDPGHGGPGYWGASARDPDGNLWIEKDLTLAVSTRLQQLLSEAGYYTILLRTEDVTHTDWNSSDYRASMIAETQERVHRANAVGADVLLAVHFNGWRDAGQRGTEAYCNPDRGFGGESCELAWFVQQAVVQSIRATGYDIFDRGIKNDAAVNGDPQNQHSFLLGTNSGFSPSMMPGAILEVLFLSHPDDFAFIRREDAIEVVAKSIVEGLNQYFAWLTGY